MKKILAFILSFMLVFTMIPAVAFATDETPDPAGTEVSKIYVTMQFPHEDMTWGEIKSNATVTSDDAAIEGYEIVLCKKNESVPLDDIVFEEGQKFELIVSATLKKGYYPANSKGHNCEIFPEIFPETKVTESNCNTAIQMDGTIYTRNNAYEAVGDADGKHYEISSSMNINTVKKHTEEIAATTKATATKDGVGISKCSLCGKVLNENVVIPMASKVSISKASYTYTGKAITPVVTVKDSTGEALDPANYTIVAPAGRKNVGKYVYKVQLCGNYEGSKNLTFTINPKGTSLKSLKAGKKSFAATWSKQATQTTGYQLRYSTSSKFSSYKTVTITNNKTVKKTVKKLKAKKKYYVQVRTYKSVSGKKYYSSWSKAKTIKTK